MKQIISLLIIINLFSANSQKTCEFLKNRPAEIELIGFSKLLTDKSNDPRIESYKIKEQFEATIVKYGTFKVITEKDISSNNDSVLIYAFQITQDNFSQELKERVTLLKQPSGDNSVFFNEAKGELTVKFTIKDSKSNTVLFEKQFTSVLSKKGNEKDYARDASEIDLTNLAKQCSNEISISILKCISNWNKKITIEFEDDKAFDRLSESIEFINQKNWEGALEILKVYADDEAYKTKQKAKSCYNYAIALLYHSEFEKAKEFFDKAIILSPKEEKYISAIQLVEVEKNQDKLLNDRETKKSVEREKYLADLSVNEAQNNSLTAADKNTASTEGKNVQYYEEGKIQSIGDRINGEYIEYYYEGQIKLKCNYLNGKENGEHLEYYLNGQLKSKWAYNNEEFNGEYLSYYSNGQLERKEYYINGKQEGEILLYYEDGQIQIIGHFKNGKNHGEYNYYFKNGIINLKRNYVNGIENGESISYFKENGKVRLVGNVRNGKQVGEWREYYPSGQLESKNTKDENGYGQGVSLEYHENGQLQCKKNWKNSTFHGEVVCYNEKGEVYSRETYVNGVKQ